MATEFDLAQTFYIDPDAVKLADTIYLTSVDLFFQDKPVQNKTKTGIGSPGVTVYLCPVYNDVPDVGSYYIDSRARREYSEINVSNTAVTATKFEFEYPVPVSTDRSYAVLIKFDGSDPDFQLWWNRAGEKVLSTENNTQVSSGKIDGYFYKLTNGNNLQAMKDADLKFTLRTAKFTSQSEVFRFSNKHFEFFKYHANSVTGNFKGGEYAYQNAATAAGTLNISNTSTSVTGSGTSFLTNYQVGDHILITDGTAGNTNVRHITAIASDTALTLDQKPSFSNNAANYIITAIGYVYDFDSMTEHLFLEDSTANTTVKFAVNAYVKGVDSQSQVRIKEIKNYDVGYIRANLNVSTPAGTYVNVSVNFANSTYDYDNNTARNVELGTEVFIDDYPAVVASRSNEVVNAGGLFTGGKTFEAQVNFVSANPYTSPYVKEENLDLFTYRFDVNNDSTNEHTVFGNAVSKAVSKKVVLADGQDAEDLRVFLTAYKPQGTSIELYAKFQHAADVEPFDNKEWTKLELTTSSSVVSSPYNRDDLIELEYKVPSYPAGTAIDGIFQTTEIK